MDSEQPQPSQNDHHNDIEFPEYKVSDFSYQPGQVYSPRQSPRRRSFRQWYKSKGRFTKLGLGCGFIFLLLMLCMCSLAAYGSTLPPQKTVQPTPNTNSAVGQIVTTATTDTAPTAQSSVSVTPSIASTPTATSKPKIHPYYGGTIKSFLDWYGQPMDDLWKQDGVRYDFNVWSNNPYIGLIVDADGVHGPDANIVWLMSPNKVAWNLAQAANYCTPFLPPDAKLVKKNHLIWIYKSTLIQSTVNPSGVFNITYDMSTDTSIGPVGIFDCVLTGGMGN